MATEAFVDNKGYATQNWVEKKITSIGGMSPDYNSGTYYEDAFYAPSNGIVVAQGYFHDSDGRGSDVSYSCSISVNYKAVTSSSPIISGNRGSSNCFAIVGTNDYVMFSRTYGRGATFYPMK